MYQKYQGKWPRLCPQRAHSLVGKTHKWQSYKTIWNYRSEKVKQCQAPSHRLEGSAKIAARKHLHQLLGIPKQVRLFTMSESGSNINRLVHNRSSKWKARSTVWRWAGTPISSQVGRKERTTSEWAWQRSSSTSLLRSFLPPGASLEYTVSFQLSWIYLLYTLITMPQVHDLAWPEPALMCISITCKSVLFCIVKMQNQIHYIWGGTWHPHS